MAAAGAGRSVAKAVSTVFDRPTRDDALSTLSSGNEWDLLVIGGGATGAGIALDAATRNLKVAMVERGDFASGTSSRSTKLVHGGVRYLEAAVWQLSWEQYKLVQEALAERQTYLANAPHLTTMLPIMLPVYQWWKVPYFYAGVKAYDIVAGRANKHRGFYMSPTASLKAFPHLKKDGLAGSLVYYDGQTNDARMNVSVAMSAADHNATVCTYANVVGLLKDDDGKVVGAMVVDSLDASAKPFPVRAKVVVNATGPFSDAVRKLDDPSTPDIIAPSSGTHVVLPDYASPREYGLIDPATSDAWEDATIAGTTDVPCATSKHPSPSEAEIRFILKECEQYLSDDIQLRRSDVLSAWTGIRPLASDPSAADTSSISRHHVIDVNASGMVTVAGGKWTTYRRMAQDAVDRVLDMKPELAAKAGPCVTASTKVVGGEGYHPNLHIRLIQAYGVDSIVAQHLARTYGTEAHTVCRMAEATGKRWPTAGRRLVEGYPYIAAEVKYAARHELAMTATDILSRRTRLAFLNKEAAREALPVVIDILSKEHGWNSARRQCETDYAVKWLSCFGGPVPREGDTSADRDAVRSAASLAQVAELFAQMDADKSGVVTVDDMVRVFKQLNVPLTEDQVRVVFLEIDAHHKNSITFDQFAEWWGRDDKSKLASQLASCMKTAVVRSEYP